MISAGRFVALPMLFLLLFLIPLSANSGSSEDSQDATEEIGDENQSQEMMGAAIINSTHVKLGISLAASLVLVNLLILLMRKINRY